MAKDAEGERKAEHQGIHQQLNRDLPRASRLASRENKCEADMEMPTPITKPRPVSMASMV